MINCSTKGINAISYYTETISYVQTAAYSVHLGLQFSVFGETLFITAQNMAIIALMWHFDKHIHMTEKFLFSAFLVGYSGVLFSGMVPEEGWALVSSSTIVLMLMSKVPQIHQNFRAKSTGHLAFITFLLMFAGSAARTATVFFESEDLMLRFQYGLGLLLGGIIMVQFALYWHHTEEKVDSHKKTETPKKSSVYEKVNKSKPDSKKHK